MPRPEPVAQIARHTASGPDLRGSAGRVLVVSVVLVLATLAFAAVGAGVAHAEAYRYWGYFNGTTKGGGWAFATKGSGQTVPTNGAVEGWRFAVADESATRFPRTTATFGDVCPAGVAVAPGTKRVAVYVDYGVAADAPNKAAGPPAPTATCVSAPAAATGTRVLTKAVGTRVVKQQVCGIDGYPTSGCGDPVANPPSFPNPEPKVTFAGTGASSSPTPSPSPAPSTSPSVSPSGGPVISPSTSPSTSPSISPAAATGGTGTSASSWVLVGALIAAVVAAASWLLVRTRGRH